MAMAHQRLVRASSSMHTHTHTHTGSSLHSLLQLDSQLMFSNELMHKSVHIRSTPLLIYLFHYNCFITVNETVLMKTFKHCLTQ